MTAPVDVDVVIAGGGIAGAATAAALQQIGYKVLVVEPGLHQARRLAGELLHPPGVAGLAEIGLLDAVKSSPAVPISGFSVFSDEMPRDAIRLPYALVSNCSQTGIGLDHVVFRERLLEAAKQRPGVTVKQGARVVGIDRTSPDAIVVRVQEDDVTTPYRCRLLVGADGASSNVAKFAGISVRKRRVSLITSYRLSAQNLPEPDCGHIFLGPPTTVLLYPIGTDSARILFDLPDDGGPHGSAVDRLDALAALPPTLRQEIRQTAAAQPTVSFHAQTTVPSRVVSERVVLVGDAGGTCHPLTATGMTMCISDALRLRNALKEADGDVARALPLYEHERRWPQATRLVLADALHGAFCGVSPEIQVVRHGILMNWRASAGARAATMALLTTIDARPLSLVRQMASVLLRGLRSPIRVRRGDGTRRRLAELRLWMRLLAYFANQIRHIIGAFWATYSVSLKR